jgi:hypothetical protein
LKKELCVKANYDTAARRLGPDIHCISLAIFIAVLEMSLCGCSGGCVKIAVSCKNAEGNGPHGRPWVEIADALGG